MKPMWDLISSDFLEFTLNQHPENFQDDSEFVINNTLQAETFKAHLLANGILLLLPNHHTNEKFLVLSAGIHGNETAPMELLRGWCQDIFNGGLRLNTPLLLIIGNPLAAVNATRFMEENLNRLFHLKVLQKADNLEQVRAQEIIRKLTAIQQQYHFEHIVHFDLHTAIRPSKHEKFLALPYVSGNNSQPLLQFWSDCGLTAALRSVAPAATFSYFSQSQMGAISATVELGKVNAFGENDLLGLTAVDAGVRDFIELGSWPESKQTKILKLYQVKAELLKTSDDFKLNIGADFANFSEFESGYILAEDKSTDYKYIIDTDKDVLVFPNTNLPVGQRAGLVAECIN